MTWGGLDLTSFEETNQGSQWLVKMWRWRVLIPSALPWADTMQGIIGNVGGRGDTAQTEFHYGQSLTTLTTIFMDTM